jgi:hypothetical protein
MTSETSDIHFSSISDKYRLIWNFVSYFHIQHLQHFHHQTPYFSDAFFFRNSVKPGFLTRHCKPHQSREWPVRQWCLASLDCSSFQQLASLDRLQTHGTAKTAVRPSNHRILYASGSSNESGHTFDSDTCNRTRTIISGTPIFLATVPRTPFSSVYAPVRFWLSLYLRGRRSA